MLEKSQRCSYSYKKRKTINKDYGPAFLLPICRKIPERLLYNEMFSTFIENNLISPNQSGFKPQGSCINQLLSITHETCKSFDDGWEVRGVFLNISKIFNKVWHEGVLFKLKQNEISGNLLQIMEKFPANWYQRVVFQGQISRWAVLNTGITQGSILGPLFFWSILMTYHLDCHKSLGILQITLLFFRLFMI